MSKKVVHGIETCIVVALTEDCLTNLIKVNCNLKNPSKLDKSVYKLIKKHPEEICMILMFAIAYALSSKDYIPTQPLIVTKDSNGKIVNVKPKVDDVEYRK